MSAAVPQADGRDPVDDAAQDWFLRLSSGDVAEADRRAFAAWREADPRHAAAYAEIEGLWHEVAPLEAAFAPRGRAGPRQEAPAVGRQRARPWRRPTLAAGVAGACLALLVTTGIVQPMGMLADHYSGIGHRHVLTLPDGTVAHLNTDTAIDVAYSPGLRQVRLLRGEAYFEVRKDAARPFEVAAEGGRTTAVGTAFVVRDAGAAAVVTVAEGTVRVDSPAAAGVERGVLVTAGQQVRYGAGDRPGTVRTLDPATETAWLRGQIVIRNRPLADALAEIGRYRAGRIVLLRDGSDLQPVTARVALDDLDGGIDALAATHGLSVTRLTPYLVILR
ncbi:FecR family protein [Azospirillum sp. ST 5-10]|uniref:FecR family protein n=1 Tax=unclassified Azospirillum TaxID=2630922 RepID=UPI003F4A3051